MLPDEEPLQPAKTHWRIGAFLRWWPVGVLALALLVLATVDRPKEAPPSSTAQPSPQVVAEEERPPPTPALQLSATTAQPLPTDRPAQRARSQLFLPFTQRGDIVVAAQALRNPVYLPVAMSGAGSAAFDASQCTVHENIRITWYELGSCCNKAPGHPQYGITRSGLHVAWGMAAVQARYPLLPMGTRFIVADIGPDYRFVVTDTGSEMAFGGNWIDLYAPTIETGLWMERKVGRDGRSAVLICPET